MKINEYKINCIQCGKLTNKYRDRNYKRVAKFCNSQCYYDWKKDNPDKHNRWLGDKVGYQGIHIWMRKTYGNAFMCEYDLTHKSSKFEWANITGIYTRDRHNFVMLCHSCHKSMDYGFFCKRGHKFDEKNTYIDNDNHRICRLCRRDYMRSKRSKIKDNI